MKKQVIALGITASVFVTPVTSIAAANINASYSNVMNYSDQTETNLSSNPMDVLKYPRMVQLEHDIALKKAEKCWLNFILLSNEAIKQMITVKNNMKA